MNIFNGKYLEYYVDNALYYNIHKIIGPKPIELYNNKYVKLLLEPNKKYILPIGLFSNPDLVLNCKWGNSNRNFNNVINNISCNIILKDKQEIIIKEFLKHRNIIIEKNKAPIYINLIGHCSIGKTVMAIYLINKLKLKTFIITPSLELAKQWGKEISKFLQISAYYVSLNGVKSFLKDPKKNEYDIICFPYKHLTDTEFHEFLMENYSLGIIDEQHKYNLETNDVLQYFLTFCSFPAFISLTATPRRFNKLYLGREIDMNTLSSIETFEKIAYEVLTPGYKSDASANTKEYITYRKLKKTRQYIRNKELLLSIYKKKACASDIFRNQNIVHGIVESFKEDSKILVLTKFIEDIDRFYSMLKKYINEKYLFKIYASDRNNSKALINIKQKLKDYDQYIIIGTEDHLGTGIDIVELNILHLTSFTTNKRNIIQYAGRVSRENSSKTHYIYYYNINSLKNLEIEKEISIIRQTLTDNNWTCLVKKHLF
jgi:superfamily II DNA or RNA helicase